MLRRVVAHWPVIIVTMVLGAVITLQVVRTRKATFKSETVIFYKEGVGKSVLGSTDAPDAVRSLGTKLKETLLAQQNLRKLIDEFRLYPELVQKGAYAEAVDQMRKKTEFKARSQETFAITFEGLDKDQAQKVCARMAEVLVAENDKRLQEENRGATEILEAEKKKADDDLNRVERQLSQFLQMHPEFASAKDGFGTEALKVKADEDERRRGRAKPGHGARRGTAQVTPGAPPVDDRASAVDPVLLASRSQAQADLSAAQRDLADKSSNFTEQHPAVREAMQRVAAAQAALKRAQDAIDAATPKDEAPRKQQQIVDDPYAEPPKPVASVAPNPNPNPDSDEDDKPKPKGKDADADQGEKLVTLEMEWARLGRDLANARAHQGDLETKLYRAQMVANTAESGYGTRIAVLDPAYKPSGPSNAPNRTVVMIGLAASIVVGVVLSAAWGLFLDDRLFAASEIEGVVMVPVLGVVPREKRKEKPKDKGSPGRKWGLSRG